MKHVSILAAMALFTRLDRKQRNWWFRSEHRLLHSRQKHEVCSNNLNGRLQHFPRHSHISTDVIASQLSEIEVMRLLTASQLEFFTLRCLAFR